MVLICLLCAAGAWAQGGDHPARARLLADVSAIKPGEPFTLGIMLKMQPGWHVYWINPGDSGQPPQVKWTLPDGFKIDELEFPVPMRFDEPGNLIAYGYKDEVLLTATVYPPAELKATDETEFAADVTWLVCEQVCLPGDAKLSIRLPVSDSAAPANREIFQRWLDRMPREPHELGIDVKTTKDWDKHELHIEIDWKDQDPANIEWFAPAADDVNFSPARISSSGRTTTVVCRFSPLARKPLPQMTMRGLVAYDASDGSRRGVLVPFDLKPDRSVIVPTN